MYNFLLVIFIIIDTLLIFLIMIQNRTNSGEVYSSFGTSNNQFLTSFNNPNKLIYITSVFSGLFFLISLMISNVNYHEHDSNRILLHSNKIFMSVNEK